MNLVIVGDELYGRRAANHLGLPYRSMSSLGETDSYIAVVTTAHERERICDALGREREAAVIACCQDCKPLVQLAVLVGLFCGAGVENFWEFLAATDRLAIGMCVGALVALVGILVRRLSESGHENRTPLRLLGGAGSPVFLFAALFSLILR